MNKILKVILLSSAILFVSGCSHNQSTTSTTGSTTSSTSGSTSSTSGPHGPGNGIIDLYCVNDVHGRVNPTISENGCYEGGISRLSTYLSKKIASNPTGSVFLNAGDLWQDTYDSAMNKGELLTKAMVQMDCEAIALGNHEFDWGVDQIKANRAIAESSSNKTQFTFLGCNVYNYGGTTSTHADDLCSSYKVINRGDVRIGLIGAIGEKQLTSITSSNWENLTFRDPVPIVKSLSRKLRNEEKCDVIVYLFHGSLNQAEPDALSSIDPETKKPYVDAGFLGHSHQFENEMINSVPWIQSYQHGAVLGRITLKVENGNVSCSYCPDYSSKSGYSGRNENGWGSGSNSIYGQADDTNVKSIVDEYITPSFIQTRDQEVVTLENAPSWIGKDAGKIQALATSKYIDGLRSLGESIPNVDIVINNGNRDDIQVPANNKLTRENIFNLIPFTNKTIIASVSGRDIINECVMYSNPYYIVSETSLTLDPNTYYTVACIDYLLLHKNTSRQYNYFSSYTSSLYTIEKFPYAITWDYFAEQPTFDMNILSSVAFTGLTY